MIDKGKRRKYNKCKDCENCLRTDKSMCWNEQCPSNDWKAGLWNSYLDKILKCGGRFTFPGSFQKIWRNE
jgi:hypothetical protein